MLWLNGELIDKPRPLPVPQKKTLKEWSNLILLFVVFSHLSAIFIGQSYF